MFRRLAYSSLLACLIGATGCTSADFNASAPGDDDSSTDDSSIGDATGDDSTRPDAPPGDTSSDSSIDTAIDGGGPDVGLDADDAIVPSDAPISCVGKPDGTPCDSSDGKRRICVAEGCTLSKCGDRIVDPGAGEECDDANDVSKDGCEPVTCKFSCHSTTDCPSTTCITGRACDTTHKCTDGTFAPKTTTCTTTAGGAGYCNSGACASASCGNHTVEPPEECDDGDLDPTNGCKNDCTFTCKSPAECTDGNACNGAESCNTTSHTCAAGAALSCDDSNPCTANGCAPATGCTNPLIDGDGDGYAPAALGTCGGGLKGGDCDDGNVAIHPGAAEVCNGVDDNCTGGIDEGISPAPGTACGLCSTGLNKCSGPTSTSCVDPVTHAPGGACGTCGKYACGSGPDTTCVEASPAPGTACGACGTRVCSGPGTTSCNEATPVVGTACGTCGTSSYACNTGPRTTYCVTPDDRKVGRDLSDEVITLAVQPSLEHIRDVALAYTTVHAGQILDLQLFVRRTAYTCKTVSTVPHFDPACTSCTKIGTTYTCTVPSPTDGTITVTAYSGTPGGTSSSLGSMSVVPSTLPSADAWFTFTFTSALASLPAGTPIWFQFHTDSTAYTIVMEGAYVSISPPPPSYQYWSKYVYPPSGSTTDWTLGSSVPAVRVDMNGCF